MVSTPRGRGRFWLVVLAAFALVIGLGGPAAAAPGDDDEGGTVELRKALDDANRAYLDAQAALEQSKARQAELTAQIQTNETRLVALRESVVHIVQAAYRTGGSLRTTSALLSAGSPESFVDKATTLNLLAIRNNRQLAEVIEASRKLNADKAALDAEIAKGQLQVEAMAKQKAAAEAALKRAGAGQTATGFTNPKGSTAAPAPRNANGSWPSQGCTANDPTTSGCLTPRTLHALQQTKAAGFTRYVSCYRSGGGGEHPRGRACDFASDQNSFGGVATGASRTYGNNLAAYYVANASRLAVLYVIWFKQIWQPSTGWRTYRSGNGDPSSDHTNHVHLSVY